MGDTSLIGRTVLVYNRHRNAGGDDANQPEAGIIVRVHDERTVNIGGFDKFGMPFSMHSVQFAPSITTPVDTTQAYARLRPRDEQTEDEGGTRYQGQRSDEKGTGTRSYVE